MRKKIPGISDQIGKEQLNNAIKLLEKGYSLYEEMEPLFDQYGSVEQVPDVNV